MKYLLKALQDFEKENNLQQLTTIQIQQMQQIIDNMKPLAKALSVNKAGAKKNKNLTASAIKKMVQNVFNTGFAEAFSSIITESAYVSLGKQFQAKLTGSENVKIEYSDEFGRAVGKGGDRSAGKADASFSNLQMKIENLGTLQNFIIIIFFLDQKEIKVLIHILLGLVEI